jgi:hypothetical protein
VYLSYAFLRRLQPAAVPELPPVFVRPITWSTPPTLLCGKIELGSPWGNSVEDFKVEGNRLFLC